VKTQRNVVRLAGCVILAALAANTGCDDPLGGGARERGFGTLPQHKAELRMATG
jgi:hypothetical protein